MEVVRRAVEAFNEGRLDTVASSVAFWDPDIEFHENPKLPEAAVCRGREAVERYFRQFLDSFQDYRFEIEEMHDAGDQVVVFNRQRGRGRESGVEVDMRNAWLFTFREGRITRIKPYWDREEAMSVAGLRD